VCTLAYLCHAQLCVNGCNCRRAKWDSTILFLHILGILHKLGLTSAPEGDWFLAGRLPSVPGALWHQFGVLGFIVSSLLLGTICAIMAVWTARQPHRLLPLGAFVMADSTLLLSPALFAGDFLSFPFVMASFILLAPVCRHTLLRSPQPFKVTPRRLRTLTSIPRQR
jgi:hypothetical protein